MCKCLPGKVVTILYRYKEIPKRDDFGVFNCCFLFGPYVVFFLSSFKILEYDFFETGEAEAGQGSEESSSRVWRKP